MNTFYHKESVPPPRKEWAYRKKRVRRFTEGVEEEVEEEDDDYEMTNLKGAWTEFNGHQKVDLRFGWNIHSGLNRKRKLCVFIYSSCTNHNEI